MTFIRYYILIYQICKYIIWQRFAKSPYKQDPRAKNVLISSKNEINLLRILETLSTSPITLGFSFKRLPQPLAAMCLSHTPMKILQNVKVVGIHQRRSCGMLKNFSILRIVLRSLARQGFQKGRVLTLLFIFLILNKKS